MVKHEEKETKIHNEHEYKFNTNNIVDENWSETNANQDTVNDNTELKSDDCEVKASGIDVEQLLKKFASNHQKIQNPYVLAIGIEKYNDKAKLKGYRSLDGVKHDLYGMIHLWRDIYGYNNIGILFAPNVKNNNDYDADTVKNNNNNNNNDNNHNGKTMEKLEDYIGQKDTYFAGDEVLCDRQKFSDNLIQIRSIMNQNFKIDGLIFYYSGHGIENKIILSNGHSFPIREIVDIFDGKNCVQLRNKPKIMILDCCRGKNVAQLQAVDNNNNDNNTINHIPKLRGNELWYDNMHHVNSGLATIFSNFSGYGINDFDNGGCLTRAIETIFQNPNLIKNQSLRDLIVIIRHLTKRYAGNEEYISSQLVDFHETLEYKVYFYKQT